MIIGRMSFGSGGPAAWMGPGASRLPSDSSATALAERVTVPALPPRIWPDHANRRVRLVIGDNTIIADMTTDRAREFARQILNAVFEADTTHRHLNSGRSDPESDAHRPL